jgi:hypothetical protein
MLAGFAYEKLGDGASDGQAKFGFGLAKAPPNCAYKERTPVARGKSTPAPLQAWSTEIKRAALQ